MKKAIVTGAAGFAGFSLTVHLLFHEYEVYAVLRPHSDHNARLEPYNVADILKMEGRRGALGNRIDGGEEVISSDTIEKRLHLIELDSSEYDRLPELIDDKCDVFFHIAWAGGRDCLDEQYSNISQAIKAIEAASELECKKYICTGSQAEYGMQSGIITEDICPNPINAYGAAKTAAMYLTRRRAQQLGIEWIWCRIFSLYGLYEPSGRMLPDLIEKLSNGDTVELSDCTQFWDYLDAGDAAEAFCALIDKGNDGEIYNIANGSYKPLRDFVSVISDKYSRGGSVIYCSKADPFISLKPCMDKLMEHTDWKPKIDFLQGYEELRKYK